MMEEEPMSDEAQSLRLDIMCLRAAMRNYSAAELESDTSVQDSDTNSILRSWVRDLWLIGSNVIRRSDPNGYSIQILQLLSQYGSGWIPINPSEISGQGSLRRSLSLLESHGLIHLDIHGKRIRIEGINLTKEIQEKSQFDQKCYLELEMIKEFIRLLNTPSEKVISHLIGLTSTLRLVLSHPQFKLTQEIDQLFDIWVHGMLDHFNQDLQELNQGIEAQKYVMTAGIKMYEGIIGEGSFPFHFRSLEIHFLVRQVLRSKSGSTKSGQNTGRSRSDSEEGTIAKDDLDLLMDKATTYITLLNTTVDSIIANQMPIPNNLNVHLYKMFRDCVTAAEQLGRLIRTDMIGILEQLTLFFRSGWNCWKHLERAHGNGDDFGRVFLIGLLSCLNKQGKLNEILTLVKETKEFLGQFRPDDRFKEFFPERVIAHALSLGQESDHEKEILFLEIESYLMGIFRALYKPGRGSNVYEDRNGVREKVLPHLFNCLAQLGRYETLHGIITDLNSHVQTLTTTTDITLRRIQPFVNLPLALAASVKDMDFPNKDILLEETFGVGRRLVRMTLDLGAYETIRKLRHDSMETLVTFSFDTGMVHELTEFLGELEIFLMNKYGEDGLGLITTAILYFGQRVTDALERIMGPIKMAKCDWSEFLEQVKCCVVKWTQLISTPPHVHEKKSWMDETVDLISRNCDSYLEQEKSRKSSSSLKTFHD